MPKKPAPKGPRDKSAKDAQRSRAADTASGRLNDLPSKVDAAAASVRGGGRKQGADPGPTDSISLTFTKPGTSY